MIKIDVEAVKNLIMDNMKKPAYKIADEMRISRQLMGKILNDKYKGDMRLITLKAICEYFGANWRDFIKV